MLTEWLLEVLVERVCLSDKELKGGGETMRYQCKPERANGCLSGGEARRQPGALCLLHS
jgi:hypothetical protein